MDLNYNPDQPYEETVTEDMADVTYLRKLVAGRQFSSSKPVAIKLNIGAAAGRALAFCGNNIATPPKRPKK